MHPSAVTTEDAVTGLEGRERIRALDLARGLAVLFMIGVHVLWHWGAPETWGTPAGLAISLLGGPTAAPVFMFLMGASLAFSRRTGTASLIGRGLWLVWLGYLLNFFRGALPATLGLEFGVVTAEQIAPFDPWWLLTSVDVHQMAGLSLVAIALLRLAAAPGPAWLAVGAGLVVAAPFLRGLETGIGPIDAALTPVWGSAPQVYYAVVPWLVYPLAGAVFGRILAAAPDRTAVFRRGALLGLVLCAAGAGLFVLDPPTFDVSTYWRHPLSYAVGIMGIVLVWLALCDLAVRRVRLDRVYAVLYGWSGRIIAIYFVHWLIVGWGVGIVGWRALGLGEVLVAIVVAVWLSSVLSAERRGLALFGWLHTPRVPEWLRLRLRPRPDEGAA